MHDLPFLDPATAGALDAIAAERLLFLDGATGTMIQRKGLDEAAFRGALLRDHQRPLQGNNDILCLTYPDAVRDVHLAYFAAGADLVETNTFSATRIAQADYDTSDHAFAINVAAARIAKEAAADSTRRTGVPRFVAGALGPLNKTLSLSPDVNDPGFRAVTFDQVEAAYADQVRGLLDGGADLLLVETIFDTLNAKAALVAIEAEFRRRGARVPLWISVTITDRSGRTLSGQTVEAFWASVRHARPQSVGLNCALGADEMRPWLRALAAVADCRVSAYPNAGLPNAFGGYDEDPATTGRLLRGFADEGLVDAVGGCCGTTPDHIAAVVQACRGVRPRGSRPIAAAAERPLLLSGLEPLSIGADSNFIVVGERTNVTGSRKFADLIKSGDFAQALAVARDQVTGGANLLDVNMDEGMTDGVAAMQTFLNLVAAEPEIARLPIMVDSSRWEVLLAGLRCLQGKGVVNSISLKDGQEAFLAKAQTIRAHGAAVVVMAFDEHGQATDTARRVEICARAYDLLVGIGVDPCDIVFDPNVLAIGTGIADHAGYAVSFLEATRAIKRRCPGARVSGGISNLSFAFRGNEPVRQAMNSAFLYHAIQAGLDMGIVNAGQIALYDDLDPELRALVEDVIFDRRPDATERLVDQAARFAGKAKKAAADDAWRHQPVAARLAHALVHGAVDHIDADVAEALAELGSPLAVIEGPLMAGMRQVGDLFGAGKMFLPQVVKSARVMKRAVAWLEPHLQAAQQDGRAVGQGTILLATVKGDVHDIGKNIVGVVLGCNAWNVVDLGVMVPAERILDEAARLGVDAIGLSGLITPSLDEMVRVAAEMARRGMKVPLFIGGATTSRAHTAVKIAPAYEGPVVHVLDASRAAAAVAAAIGDGRAEFAALVRADQERLRRNHELRQTRPLVPLSLAVQRRPQVVFDAATVRPPAFTGRQVAVDIPIEVVAPYIDWAYLFVAFDLRGKFPAVLDDPDQGAAARDLFRHAHELLAAIASERSLRIAAVWGIWPAAGDGADIAVYADAARHAELARFSFLRQQRAKTDPTRPHLCLADWVAPKGLAADHVGAFAVTAGIGLPALVERFEGACDDFSAILARALADRLAEASAEWLHREVRRSWTSPDEELSPADLIAERFAGIRPAFGYPACPDHGDKRKLWGLLNPGEVGMGLTETLAMTPAASVAGLILGHPDARTFDVGPVGPDQIADYARRKGCSADEVVRALSGTVADPG